MFTIKNKIIIATGFTVLGLGSFTLSAIHGNAIQVEKVTPKLDGQLSGEVLGSKMQAEVYDLRRTVKATLQAGRKSKPFADLHYSGRFYITKLPPDSEAISFELTNGVKSLVPFVVKTKNWSVVEIKTGPVKSEAEEESVKIMKDFISLYAFRTNEDTTGEYTAKFKEWTNEITKQKIQYKDSKLIQLSILKSVHTIKMGEKDQISSMHGQETTQARAGKTTVLSTESSYLIVHRGVTAKVAPVVIQGLVDSSLKLDDHFSKKAAEWSSLLPTLNSIRGLKKMERLSLFRELVKTLKEDPEALSNFKSWLGLHGKETGVLTFGVGVLATAGTADAQKTLIDLYQQNAESRGVILNAFTTSNAKLTPESSDFLTALADQKTSDPEHAYSAAFALGSGIKQDPSSTDVAKLQSLMNRAVSMEEKANYLDAIGNSGNSAFIPVITENLASTNEVVREKAVLALRFMNDPQAQTLILGAWNDPSTRVQAAAVRVIDYQGTPEAYVPILNQCVQDNATLRDSCARLLQEHQG